MIPARRILGYTARLLPAALLVACAGTQTRQPLVDRAVNLAAFEEEEGRLDLDRAARDYVPARAPLLPWRTTPCWRRPC